MNRLLPVAVSLAVLLGGCWDRNETNQLSFVQTIGLDWTGRRYAATVEVVNTRAVSTPSGGSSATKPQEPESRFLTGWGPTPALALQDAESVSSRRLFWPTTDTVVLGEALARRGVAPVLDTLRQFPQLPITPRVFVATGTAASALAQRDPGVEITEGRHLRLIGETGLPYDSLGYAPRVYEVLRWDAEKGHAAVIPALMAEAPRVPSGPSFRFQEAAVLVGDRLAAWMPRPYVRMTLWLTGRFIRGVFPVPCSSGKGGLGSIRVVRARGRARPRLYNHRVMGVDVMLTGQAEVVQSGCSGTPVPLRAAAEDMVYREAEATVAWAQARGLDVFGWGEDVYRADPQAWYRLEGQWPRVFRGLPVHLWVRVSLPSTGEARP